ncbi:MAG: Gfo/Idh/MocA family oxidoreductase [Pseudomonadota bacterium]
MSVSRSIALVGIGKIAHDQHIPAIAGDPNWHLAATVSRNASLDGIDSFQTIDAMLAARPDIETVSLAIPPQPRFDYARKVIEAGRNVMLEKPPGQSLAECHALRDMAEQAGVTIFATWHSRFADCVPDAKAWLADKIITRVHITWKEDVRRWHPGQDWVFEPGGMGVFDPGINALSILTEILPFAVHIESATLDVPLNRDTPIAAQLSFANPPNAAITADFDWLQTGPQTWDIAVETASGTLLLSDGGATLIIDGVQVKTGSDHEYPNLYARMAELVAAGTSEYDMRPLVHVSDALSLGRRRLVDPFEF